MDSNHRPLGYAERSETAFRRSPAELPPQELFHEGKTRGRPSDRPAIGGWENADGHPLAITFLDHVVRNQPPVEVGRDFTQMRFIPGMQSHGDRPRFHQNRGGFASCVNGLGNLRPMGEVSPDNHIVHQIELGVAIAGLPSVNGC